MKKIVLLLVAIITVLFAACDKKETAVSTSKEVESPVVSEKITDTHEKTEQKDNAVIVPNIEADEKSDVDEVPENPQENVVDKNEDVPSDDVKEPATLEEFENYIASDVAKTIAGLTAEYETLISEIDTFEKYQENTGEIEAFYDHVFEVTDQAFIRLREYSVDYAQMVIESDLSFDDMYDELDEIYNWIYEDACDELYDEIYDGILEDMYDTYYDGIIEDGYDLVAYKVYSELHSEEYDMYSDCRSDVYDAYSDCHSDIYDFQSDVNGKIYDENMDKAYEALHKFVAKIKKMKATPDEVDVESALSFTEAESLDELIMLISSDVETTLSEITAEYNTLISEIDTFEKYQENVDRIEAFYANTNSSAAQIIARLRGYSSVYAELVLELDMSNDHKYDELEEIYNLIYEDACEEIYDGIYDGVLEDMYDTYYDGVIEDGYDLVAYKVYSELHSDEYDMYSDCRSYVYDEYSDSRSDIYDFYSDVRSDVYGDDIDDAYEEIDDFKVKASILLSI